MASIKHSVLFVCIHNSARSQMAEAFLKKYGSEYFEVESAGLEPGRLNANVVEVMKRIGIDMSRNKTQSVFDLFKKGRLFDAVITVCDQASAERCPVFPGSGKRIAWSFPDPSSFTGTQEEILKRTAAVRDEIEQKILNLIKEGKALDYWI
jgi:arsenate reductase (thioredoxin)